MKQPLLFDLDGFLADFVSGVLSFYKSDLPYSSVRWGLEEQLGIAPKDFWAPLGREFWANLAPYSDGDALLIVAESLVGPERIFFLSSPCLTDGCLEGKRDWVRKYHPGYERRTFFGSAKHVFAGGGAVLVDDSDRNVDDFEAAGGDAVLIPRPWNRLRNDTDDAGRFNVSAAYARLERALQ